MKNICRTKSSDPLRGRPAYTTRFVNDKDVRGKEVLDIGCEFGLFIINAINRGATRVIGMELTESDLETASGDFLIRRGDELVAGSAIPIPFPSNSFDTVTAWEVLEHIPKGFGKKMFREVNRILKPGGKVYLSTPNKALVSNCFDPAWWLIGHRHYSSDEVRAFAAAEGFLISSCVVAGGMWDLFHEQSVFFEMGFTPPATFPRSNASKSGRGMAGSHRVHKRVC